MVELLVYLKKVVKMKSIKHLLILFLVCGTSIVSVQASNQCNTSDKYWTDITTQLSNLSSGDTLFIEKELKLKKGSWTELSAIGVTIVIKKGALIPNHKIEILIS